MFDRVIAVFYLDLPCKMLVLAAFLTYFIQFSGNVAGCLSMNEDVLVVIKF